MKYTDCIKYPSKGGYSREQLDKMALEKGLNAKSFKTKKLLCEILRDDIEKNESILVKSPAKKTVVKKTAVKKSVVKTNPVKKSVVKTNPVKKSVVKTNPVKKSVVKNASVNKIALEKIPVKKSPIEKSPVKKSPIEKSPVKKSLVEKTAVKKNVVKTTPVKKNVVKTTSVKKSPLEKSPVKKTTTKKTSTKESQTNKIPTKKTSTKESQTNKIPTKKTSTNKTSTKQSPTKKTLSKVLEENEYAKMTKSELDKIALELNINTKEFKNKKQLIEKLLSLHKITFPKVASPKKVPSSKKLALAKKLASSKKVPSSKKLALAKKLSSPKKLASPKNLASPKKLASPKNLASSKKLKSPKVITKLSETETEKSLSNRKIGILDPQGLFPNPLNNLPYSNKYKEQAKMWSKLPAYKDRIKIIKYIEKNQVVLIESNTGSGKSVLIPKYALHSVDYKGNVVMVLPKRDITVSAANFSATCSDVELGSFIGYKIKGENIQSPETRLLYATDGTLVSKINADPLLLDYDIVIIDEAHERKIQTDLLLYLLREVLYARPTFKLIIMSATIDVDLFENYYKDFKFKHIMLSGETNYPIESIFIQKPGRYEDRMAQGFDYLLGILSSIDKLPTPKRLEFQDIVFFITSQNEAFNMCGDLHNEIKDDKPSCNISCQNEILCVELFSGVNKKKKDLALDRDYRKEGYTIKVIFTTNIAESSLTINSVKYVIDNGYELHSFYDPKLRANMLNRILITQSQAIQRRGRAGRTGPGVCYHLYTKNEFDNVMEKFPKPAISTSNIFTESLSILALPKVQTIENLNKVFNNFIQPPGEEFIKTAIEIMLEKNLVTGSEINLLGKSILKIVDDPLDGLALTLSHFLDCSEQVLKIIVMCSYLKDNISGLFQVPKKEKENFENAKADLANKFGDHLTLLDIFDTYMELSSYPKQLNKWIYEYYLKENTLVKITEIYDQSNKIFNMLDNLSSELLPLLRINNKDLHTLLNFNIEDRILFCFALSQERAERNYSGNYSTQASKKFGNRLKISIDRNSFLMDEHEKLVYKKLFTSNGYYNLVIASEIPRQVSEFLDERGI